MKLSGMLSKVMDNYLCLRGVANIKDLAKVSEINPDIQRKLLDEHKGEMQDFLEKGEYAYFSEVVLSMDLGLSEEDESFANLVAIVESTDGGFNAKIGQVRINFRADDNKFIDERRHVKVSQFEFDDNMRLSRIDGNHRLSVADYLTKDVFIPFCIIIFANAEEAENNSRAIFHNINSKQIPLKLEENIKAIIKSPNVFTDSILEKNQPFGVHYKFARELLYSAGGIDFALFPYIEALVFEARHSFFTELFKKLLDDELIDVTTAVDDVKKEIVNIENALAEAKIVSSISNTAIIGALAYYKLSDSDKYSAFIQWVAKNHIADAASVRLDDIICIFDKVYDSLPKRVFLARWYPKSTDPEFPKAEHRLNAIRSVTGNLGLTLIDIGTRSAGTFDIRSVMYHDLSQSDIFIADLTGNRPNVMVEVGYALKHIDTGRMLFYFQPSGCSDKPPFDINNFRYEEINDSKDIESKIKPHIEAILKNALTGDA